MVKIRRDDGKGMPANAIRGGPSEGAVAIAEENGDNAVREVHNRQIEFPVAIEIRDRNGNWADGHTNGGAWGRTEGSIAFTIAVVAQENAYGAVVGISHS